MKNLDNKPDVPDFIVKSTLGVALVTLLFVTPFCINNFLQERYVLGALTLAISVFCAIDSWLCFKGQYHKELNLFGAAIIMVTIISAVHEQGVIGTYWAYMGLLGFYFILPEKLARIVNILFIVVVIPVAWSVLEPSIATRFTAVLVGMSIHAVISTHVITKQHYMLKEHAVTDALTGLYNRTLLQVSLEEAIQKNNRTGEAMTLITVDIDRFKNINDTLGHDAGDRMLQGIADLFHKRFRRVDKAFRLGGEEFLVILQGTDAENGKKIAEELRLAVSSQPLFLNHSITVSIGISTLKTDEDFISWMKRGDENLYRAKKEGRNRVMI